MSDELLSLLSNWGKLNKNLNTLTEEQVVNLLSYEMMTKRRKDTVVRLHQRANALRVARERDELIAQCGGN